MPPNTTEPAHLHIRSRQFFFVLSGTLSILVDGSAQELGPGKGIEIGPKIPHSVRNDSMSEVHFLVVSCPPSHGDKS
jgi:mannose-6-phosphate isomerase-like protein (cupin superfamily)